MVSRVNGMVVLEYEKIHILNEDLVKNPNKISSAYQVIEYMD